MAALDEISGAEHQDPAREVLNQAPPLKPLNLFEPTSRSRRRSCVRAAAGGSTGPVRSARRRQPEAASTAGGRAQRADPADPRPLRQPDRRGGTRPDLALAAARRDRARYVGAAMARAAAPVAHVVRAALFSLGATRRRRHVSGLDDLRGRAGAARRQSSFAARMGAATDRAWTTTAVRCPGWR